MIIGINTFVEHSQFAHFDTSTFEASQDCKFLIFIFVKIEVSKLATSTLDCVNRTHFSYKKTSFLE